MDYDAPLIPAVLERRYKRFLADVQLRSGETLTAHCPNTGSMLGCAEPGMPVWLSYSDRAGRKYAHTWEQVGVANGIRVGIHTGRTNRLVGEVLDSPELMPETAAGGPARAEVTVPGLPMRADFYQEGDGRFIEVKNVTAAVDQGLAVFPDARSSRGVRHLEVLQALVEGGTPAMLVFCAQRADVHTVSPADDIDPAYGQALRRAMAAGVDVIALGAEPTDAGIEVTRRLRVVA
ncbi:DNA/RNA nuclease SfsA [Spiribacter salinus]|jgi:sugar fermentation stimulation protein A|uniref:DNA/RNA nuclease SfsA n=1 Tax=Spiribacter salinus TaxID=1335746 RepID=UPI001C979E61|nr:DNA/RNA nuclease SfsA [Spiribacter salinus]MBY5268158.1 sugar fermentation stimulation protein SfsA [Spiribacter salinus]MDR9414300.1 DNA/RNA nuclease SfsA [Spiribacter sp.]